MRKEGIKTETGVFWFGDIGKRFEISSKSKHGSILPTSDYHHLVFEDGNETDTYFICDFLHEGNNYSVVKTNNGSNLIVLQEKINDGQTNYHPVEDMKILKAVFKKNALRDLEVEEAMRRRGDVIDDGFFENFKIVNMGSVIKPEYLADLMEPIRIRD